MSKPMDKKARSEALRLEALARRDEEIKGRSAVIASALQSVDKKVSKKITFDSDGEAEESETHDERVEGGEKQRDGEESGRKKEGKGKKRQALFEDDEEEYGEEEEEVKMTNRHSGKKGMKLMKLEAKYGNDDRFKLNDKFASDDEEDEVPEEGIQTEKSAQKKILEKVLGMSLKAEKKPKTAAGTVPSTRPFTRFDPDNEEHVKWMEMYGNMNKEKDATEELDKDKQRLEEMRNRTVEGKYVEMDADFVKELLGAGAEPEEEKEEGDDAAEEGEEGDEEKEKPAPKPGFSFLEMIGRKEVPVQETNEDKRGEEDIVVNKKLQRILNPMGFKEGETKPGARVIGTLGSAPSLAHPFFLTGDEPFIRSVVTNFRKTQSDEKIANTWSTYRESIVKVYTHMHRNAKRHLKQQDISKKFMKRSTTEPLSNAKGQKEEPKTAPVVGLVPAQQTVPVQKTPEAMTMKMHED